MTRPDSPVRRSCDALVRLGGRVLEGPCWDARAGQLLFVDIPAGTVFALDWQNRRLEPTQVGESVSAVIPRGGGEGAVLACRRGLATIDAGEIRLRRPIESDRDWTRANDAKCDPVGRLWVGTMADDERPGAGCLYRVTPDWQITTVTEGVTISNGLGWSPDGRRMYYIDSPTRRVDAFHYDTLTGEATDRQTLIDTSGFPGLPDGMCVDAEGCLWVAFYGGSVIRRFSSDGTVLAIVDLPTPNVTSCAFVGPDLDHLVITTARSTDCRAPEPGGDLFVTVPGIRGLPTVLFAG